MKASWQAMWEQSYISIVTARPSRWNSPRWKVKPRRSSRSRPRKSAKLDNAKSRTHANWLLDDQDAEKATLLTRPAPAHRDAPFPIHRSRIAQRLGSTGGIFSVRQDPFYGRTATQSAGWANPAKVCLHCGEPVGSRDATKRVRRRVGIHPPGQGVILGEITGLTCRHLQFVAIPQQQGFRLKAEV